MPVELSYSEYGNGSPVIILHGLFGSGRNWQGIARRLGQRHRVLTPDLRNHGASPHASSMQYAELAADLCRLLDRLSLQQAAWIGHSLGGKVAMAAALLHPERVARIAVLDIAPVQYPRQFDAIFDALEQLPLASIRNRNDADRHLAQQITDRGLRQFLLQNLAREGNRWRWRLNLPVLRTVRDVLRGFPDLDAAYHGPALFLHGALSDYVRSEHQASIRRHFPAASIEAVPDAAHWLHVDQPAAVLDQITVFLA
jgi:pimeloyl-ACP methyl ester carboxylesterase